MSKYYFILITLLTCLSLIGKSSAQLSGPLSGVITAGTYTIIGNISVQSGDSLTIEPGVVFEFYPDFKFDIYGYLFAVGIENDSIKFIWSFTATELVGINFYDSADDSSRLGYCVITGSNDSGIYLDHSSPAIYHCTISDNSAIYYDGGGISCNYSSPTIENCTISDNSAGWNGGGIHCYYYSSPAIVNCTISGNTASDEGGGIYCNLYSSPAIENSTISGNTADGWGGGIYCYYSDPAINNCTISGNTANCGGGLYSQWDSNLTGVNNIIWANSAPSDSQICVYESSSFFVCTYSDIQGGFVGYGNIDVDPLFVDPLNSDFHLQSASPCIDAGNPDTQYNDPEDPANPGFALYPAMGTTRNDMGVYGGQGALGWVGVSEKPSIKDYPESYMLFQNYPNPFNAETTIAFELLKPGEASLIIYDIQGCEIARLIDGFHSVGTYQRTFNASGLSSGVYFACLKAEGFSQTQKLLLIK